MGKGILVTPTVHGNLLVGPTAENLSDKESVNTTQAGLLEVMEKGALSVPSLPRNLTITSFAGLRASEAGGDFAIGEAADAPGFFDCAGIESPGLSSAPAIGVFLAKQVAAKLSLPEKTDFNPRRKGIPCVASASPDELRALIAKDPSYGVVVCRCETVTEGEIKNAIHRPLGARSLDGVKRRTRAGMGRCQAGFCSPKVMELLEKGAFRRPADRFQARRRLRASDRVYKGGFLMKIYDLIVIGGGPPGLRQPLPRAGRGSPIF